MKLDLAIFLIFLTLKLTNVITWSWWWVTAPLWGPVAAIIAICLLVLLYVGVDKLLEKIDEYAKDNQ